MDEAEMLQLREEIAKFMQGAHQERERMKRITPLSDDVIRYITAPTDQS